MGHKRNTIHEEEYKERMDKLMPRLEGIKSFESKADVYELFFLYNDRLTPRKTKMSCGKCKSYVLNRMLTYYKELNETQSTKEERQ